MIVASILGELLLGWLLADLMSGFFHWFEDEIAEEDWPVIGPLITVPNRLHHHKPLVFLESTFVQRNWINTLLSLLVGAGLAVVFGPHLWIAAAVAGGSIVNEVHAWAHRPKTVPRLVGILQETGLLQSHRGHAFHHRGEHNSAYCALTNFLNPILDAVKFWRGVEWMLDRGRRIASSVRERLRAWPRQYA